MRAGPRSIRLLAPALCLVFAAEAHALERCRATVDKKDGTLVVSATGAAGPVLWGPTADDAIRPFANAASCVSGDRVRGCVLGEPGSARRILPPPLCSLHLTDGVESCAAYIRGCTPGARDIEKRVFVTSANFTSNLGGLAGADASCQSIAEGAGLFGHFRAWLSDATESPATRFLRSSVPYVRLDGAVVAENWLDLTDGTLQNPINVNELGASAAELVWTNTTAAGTPEATAPEDTCQNWTVVNLSQDGPIGASSATDGSWTDSVDVSLCGNFDRALYCFEQ